MKGDVGGFCERSAKTARSHLRAASALHRSKNYDAAVYFCGYTVEIALKARICRTLRWAGFPATPSEFQPYKSLQTHNLETLVKYTALENRIKSSLQTDWLLMAQWSPEMRYAPVGTQTATDAADMIQAARRLLRMLL